MSLEVTGKIVEIYDEVQVSDKFRKREFVIETSEEINGSVYTNYAKFQAVQNKCDILDRFDIGQIVRVHFNIKGNRWERDGKVNYITNLDAWRIESLSTPAQASHTPAPQAAAQTTGGYVPQTSTAVDDLPF